MLAELPDDLFFKRDNTQAIMATPKNVMSVKKNVSNIILDIASESVKSQLGSISFK